MFFWTKPSGLKAFGMSKEKAKDSAVLAMNQGLYNGVLALGLVYASFSGNIEMKLFFLTSIILLGLFGGFTAHKKIILVQSLPAFIALVMTIFIK